MLSALSFSDKTTQKGKYIEINVYLTVQKFVKTPPFQGLNRESEVTLSCSFLLPLNSCHLGDSAMQVEILCPCLRGKR